jgi:hypothetical protein
VMHTRRAACDRHLPSLSAQFDHPNGLDRNCYG